MRQYVDNVLRGYLLIFFWGWDDPHTKRTVCLLLITTACDTTKWAWYNGRTCGHCTALVTLGKNLCKVYCEDRGLKCVDAWDDTNNEQCSCDAPKLGCDHKFQDTSDGICRCAKVDENVLREGFVCSAWGTVWSGGVAMCAAIICMMMV